MKEEMIKEASNKIEIFFLDFFKTNFSRKENPQTYYSVFTGYAGILLLYAEYYKVSKNKELRDKINEIVSLAIDEVNSEEKINPTYCTGLAGFAMLLIYLKENEVIIPDDDFFESIDEFLEAGLDYFLTTQNIDILHGAMGISLYFIKRGNLSATSKMISYLEHNLEYLDLSATWRKLDPASETEYRYDYSLSHGNASILYFLAKCFSSGFNRDQTKRIITKLVQFYRINIQDRDVIGSFYPGHLTEKEFKSPERDGSFSRMAWCYGDLGILHTILLVSKWIDDEQLLQWAVDRLKETTYRRDFQETLCRDAGFCHGSAGIAYIYRNVYRMTKIEHFEDAEKYWLKQTVSYGNSQDNRTCGYLFITREGLFPNFELLEGLVGVGLVLFERSNNSTSEWNSFFFLS